MAHFVTFMDKLGHTSSCASMLLYDDGRLPCEIKALEKKLERELLAPKMQL